MMHHAEKHNLLAPKQYRGRKHHRPIIAALNKPLTMDLLRLRRQTGALCSNDAKSCYDQIVHSFASIATRSSSTSCDKHALNTANCQTPYCHYLWNFRYSLWTELISSRISTRTRQWRSPSRMDCCQYTSNQYDATFWIWDQSPLGPIQSATLICLLRFCRSYGHSTLFHPTGHSPQNCPRNARSR